MSFSPRTKKETWKCKCNKVYRQQTSDDENGDENGDEKKLSVNDYKPVCSMCDNTICCDYFQCENRVHPIEYYGRSILQRNYCKECIYEVKQIDGSTEDWCKNCVGLTELYIAFPMFRDFSKIFFRDENGEYYVDDLKEEFKDPSSLKIIEAIEKIHCIRKHKPYFGLDHRKEQYPTFEEVSSILKEVKNWTVIEKMYKKIEENW